MMDVRPALDALVDQLAAAGITATTEAQEVPVPGCWLAVESITPVTRCLADLTVGVHLVTADAGAPTALAELGRLLDAALAVVTPDDDINMTSPVVLPHDPTPLPAAVFTTTVDLAH